MAAGDEAVSAAVAIWAWRGLAGDVHRGSKSLRELKNCHAAIRSDVSASAHRPGTGEVLSHLRIPNVFDRAGSAHIRREPLASCHYGAAAAGDVDGGAFRPHVFASITPRAGNADVEIVG